MRTLVMVGVMGLLMVGGVGCGPKRVQVANTPEGNACRRECMTFFNQCFDGKRRNKKLCTARENECLTMCPGASSEEVAAAPPPPAPVEPNAAAQSCVASDLPEWQTASAAEKRDLMAKCRASP